MHVLGPLRRVRLLVQGLHDVHGARAEAAADGVHEYHDQVAVRGHVEDDLGERGGGEMIVCYIREGAHHVGVHHRGFHHRGVHRRCPC